MLRNETAEPEGVSWSSEPEISSLSPEPETKPEPEPEPFPQGEPVPEWTEAMEKWGVFWQLHIYTVAILFTVLSVLGLFHTVKLVQRAHMTTKTYFLVLNSLILLLCVIRSVYFFTDPYNCRDVFPPVVAFMSENIAFPCLSSAFTILFAALLKTTMFRPISERILNKRVLAGIVAGTFTLSLSADFITIYVIGSGWYFRLCRAVYIAWGVVFGGLYVYVCLRLAALIGLWKPGLQQSASSNNTYEIDCSSITESSITESSSRPKVPVAVKVTAITACCFLVISILNTYGLAVNQDILLEPWRWWVYSLSLRLAEIGMCSTIQTVITLALFRN